MIRPEVGDQQYQLNGPERKSFWQILSLSYFKCRIEMKYRCRWMDEDQSVVPFQQPPVL